MREWTLLLYDDVLTESKCLHLGEAQFRRSAYVAYLLGICALWPCNGVGKSDLFTSLLAPSRIPSFATHFLLLRRYPLLGRADRGPSVGLKIHLQFHCNIVLHTNHPSTTEPSAVPSTETTRCKTRLTLPRSTTIIVIIARGAEQQ